MKLMLERRLASFCIWLVAFAAQARGTLLASSKLEKCLQTSTATSTDVSLSCKQKIVVTLTIAGGQSLATESLDFELACVSEDGNCPCDCNYAIDAECTCRDLQEVLRVQITKSKVQATYALTYVKSFNFWPVEKVQYTNKCVDGELATDPTCGRYLLDGTAVPDSQGFCCSCSAGQVWTDSLGAAKERTRAGLNCDFFENPYLPIFGSPPGSAHCLVYSPLWYQGYDLAESILDFTITLNMTTSSGAATGSAQNTTSSAATLAPDHPAAASADSRLRATLVGDLQSYQALPVFSSKLLLIPAPADASLDQILKNSPEKWMIVDKSDVSSDGTQCNKIGTSFAAFRFQSSGCSQTVGSCLNNQIGKLKQADEAKLVAGQTPVYFVARYLQGGTNSVLVTGGKAPTFRLALPVAQIQNSVVVLEVDAASVRFTVNVAPAKIVLAEVCGISESSACGVISALNSKGYLRATIQNEGIIPADFIVTAGNCSHPVQSMPAQNVALAAKAEARLTFEVSLATTEAKNNTSCWVDVLDSQNVVTDSKQVFFSVLATTFDNLAVSDGVRESLNGVCCLVAAVRRGLLSWLLTFLCSRGSSGSSQNRHRQDAHKHAAWELARAVHREGVHRHHTHGQRSDHHRHGQRSDKASSSPPRHKSHEREKGRSRDRHNSPREPRQAEQPSSTAHVSRSEGASRARARTPPPSGRSRERRGVDAIELEVGDASCSPSRAGSPSRDSEGSGTFRIESIPAYYSQAQSKAEPGDSRSEKSRPQGHRRSPSPGKGSPRKGAKAGGSRARSSDPKAPKAGKKPTQRR